jgi:hypothetical protein
LATKELAAALRQHTISHSLFHQGILCLNQSDCCPPPTLLLAFSLIEEKTKGCHLDTIEDIEAELQAVMSILTDHDLQDAFKKRQKRLKRCVRAEGNYFRR